MEPIKGFKEIEVTTSSYVGEDFKPYREITLRYSPEDAEDYKNYLLSLPRGINSYVAEQFLRAEIVTYLGEYLSTID
jgi:hypothetical protein